eukprot:9490773-Pyramimonas_sp.AAC.1
MVPPTQHCPKIARATLPAKRILDGRFGGEAHTTGSYSAKCDTFPPGGPLLVWKVDASALGCFIWKAQDETGCTERAGLPEWDQWPLSWFERKWNATWCCRRCLAYIWNVAPANVD